MGNGRRCHQHTANEQPQERLLKKASVLDRATRVLCVVSLAIALLTVLMPLWSAIIISDNLAADSYTAQETAALSPVVRLGLFSVPLLLAGWVLMTILLWARKPWLSLIGGGIAAAGGALLVIFAISVGQVFPYREVVTSGGIREIGLAFSDLIWRYYIALAPFVTMIAALVCALLARRHREVADIMASVADTSPTIALADENDLEG